MNLGLHTDVCPHCRQILLIRGWGLNPTLAEISAKVWQHVDTCPSATGLSPAEVQAHVDSAIRDLRGVLGIPEGDA